MGRKPDLKKIIASFEKGKDFTLTRQQYINSTGIDIPQNASYIKKSSAVAKKAMEYGYKIDVIPEKLIFTKIN